LSKDNRGVNGDDKRGWFFVAYRRYALGANAALLLFAAHAQAKDISYQQSWTIAKSAQAIEKVITDYARYCDQGCKYRYPSVKQTLVVSLWRRPHSFYVWTFVENIKNSIWFSHVTIEKKGARTAIRFTMLTDNRIRALEQATGKPHRPLFDACQTEYQIRELSTAGRFQKSVLTFRARVTVTGIISWFSGSVRSGLEEAAQAVYSNISSK
jgi:hypothetical protein